MASSRANARATAERRIRSTSAHSRALAASISRLSSIPTANWRLPVSTTAEASLVAADLLNDRVIPFFDEHQIPLGRVLTDRGTEYCGAPERHEYELYLAVENIDHTRTKVKSPQTNGIVERFHKTVLNEFYRVAFRRKIYSGIEQLQADLDAWLREYNESRPHQGRWCYGKTPMQTFRDSVPLAKEKMLGSTTASAAAESLGL